MSDISQKTVESEVTSEQFRDRVVPHQFSKLLSSVSQRSSVTVPPTHVAEAADDGSESVDAASNVAVCEFTDDSQATVMFSESQSRPESESVPPTQVTEAADAGSESGLAIDLTVDTEEVSAPRKST